MIVTFIVAGLVTGSIYAIAGLGLTLTYKTTGVFNIGYGAVAAGATMLMYSLHVVHKLPWPLALALAVLGYGALAGLGLERLTKRLAQTPTSSRIVGTVALVLVVQGVGAVVYGDDAKRFPQFLPTASVKVFGAYVTAAQGITLALGLGAAVGLLLLFRLSRVGLAMRAVVDDPELLDMTGQDPDRIRRSASIIGGVLAALSGALIGPQLGLYPVLLVLLVVQAFGAVAIGRFANLGATYAGGLAVGVLQSLVQYPFPTTVTNWAPTVFDKIAQLQSSVPFLVLFVVLLAARPGRLVELGATVRAKRARSSDRSRRSRNAALALVGCFLLVAPMVVGTRLSVWTAALTSMLLFLSLGLLVGFSGQVSLCQVGFSAVGAAAFSHFAALSGLPWLLALLLSGLVVIPVGAVIAFPAIRLAGLFLALATLGFGILLAQVGYPLAVLFGPTGTVTAARPSFLGASSDRGYYYLVLVVVVLAAGLVTTIDRSRLGRLLRALGDAPAALSVAGARTQTTQVLVFCLSSFLAGLAGALVVPITGFASSTGFQYFNSLVLVAVLTVCGRSTVLSAVLAGALYSALPSYLGSDQLLRLQPLIFGVVALVVASSTGTSRARIRWSGRAGRDRSVSPIPARTPRPEAVFS